MGEGFSVGSSWWDGYSLLCEISVTGFTLLGWETPPQVINIGPKTSRATSEWMLTVNLWGWSPSQSIWARSEVVGNKLFHLLILDWGTHEYSKKLLSINPTLNPCICLLYSLKCVCMLRSFVCIELSLFFRQNQTFSHSHIIFYPTTIALFSFTTRLLEREVCILSPLSYFSISLQPIPVSILPSPQVTPLSQLWYAQQWPPCSCTVDIVQILSYCPVQYVL